MKKEIAQITNQEGETIAILCDEDTFKVTLETGDIGDIVAYSDIPTALDEAFDLVGCIWGEDPTGIWQLEWLADYDGDKIIPLKA